MRTYTSIVLMAVFYHTINACIDTYEIFRNVQLSIFALCYSDNTIYLTRTPIASYRTTYKRKFTWKNF